MASMALDLTTIGHALNTIRKEGIGAGGWQALNQDQKQFLEWYMDHLKEIELLDSLRAKTSDDYRVLNDYLEENKFRPVMKPFNGLGVVSILDMLVEWLVQCTVTKIGRTDSTGSYTVHPGFDVPEAGASIYAVAGYDEPLVELKTKTGHSLWLQEAPRPESGISLALRAQSLLAEQRTPHTMWTFGATVPMLEMDLTTGLDWLLGLSTQPGIAPQWEIVQATQQFKLRMNEKGARVKVATSIGLEVTSIRPSNYEFQQPFIGFVTQPGHPDIALAAFWADTDVWRQPEGALEDM